MSECEAASEPVTVEPTDSASHVHEQKHSFAASELQAETKIFFSFVILTAYLRGGVIFCKQKHPVASLRSVTRVTVLYKWAGPFVFMPF